MGIFLNTEDVKSSVNETSFAEMPPTSAMENWKSSYDAVRRADASDSMQYSMRESFDEAAKIAAQHGAKISNPFVLGSELFDEFNTDPGQEVRVKDFFSNTIPALQQNNPKAFAALKDRGFDNEENFYKQIATDSKEAQQHHQLIKKNSNSWKATAASYGGMGACYMVDPIMQGAMVASFGYSIPSGVLASAVRISYMEAIINGIAETGIQAFVQPRKIEQGFEGAGIAEAINKIGLMVGASAVLGAGLTVGFAGVGKGINKFQEGAYPKIVSYLENLPTQQLGHIFNRLKNKPELNIDEAAVKSVADENILAPTAEGIAEHAARNDAVLTRMIDDTKPLTIGPMPKTPVNEAAVKAEKIEIDNLQGFKTTYKPNEIEFDAAAFQYKSGGDIEGLLPKLKNVKVWDAMSSGDIIVYEFAPKINYKTGDVVTISSKGEKATIDRKFFINKESGENIDDLTKFIITTADGKTGTITLTKLKEFNKGRKVIVDGHQRLGLAKKLQKEGQDIELSAYVFREANGIVPEQAKIKGVVVNLRNGTGTAIDAAYALRKANIDWNDLKKSISNKETMAVRVDGMLKLNDDAFDFFVANKEKLSEDLVSLIGEHITKKELHLGLIGKLANKKFGSKLEMELALKQINDAPTFQVSQESLFGTEIIEESLVFEKAELLANAIKEIKNDKKIFATLNKNINKIESAGNTLNKEINLNKEITNAETLDKIATIASRVGELSDYLNAAARILKEGKTAEAKRAAMEAIQRANSRGDFNSLGNSRPVSGGQAQKENGTLPQKTSEEICVNNKFKNIDEPVPAPKPTRQTIDEDISKHSSRYDNNETTVIQKEIDNLNEELGLAGKLDDQTLDTQIVTGEIISQGGVTEIKTISLRDALKLERQEDNLIRTIKDC